MLTLKKVKELVEAPSHAKRTPSPKMLFEEGIVLLRRDFDQGSHLTVYNSGYVLFSAGKRNTVFHIHDCQGDYAYDAAEGKGDVIEEEYFENCEWHMRMYEEYAAGTLPLDTYKQKKRECDRRISEVQEQIEQSKAEESAESVVPGTVRAAAEQAENFLNGTRLTAGMVSAFIENVFVHDGGRIVVRFKYERSIQDTVKALHTS